MAQGTAAALRRLVLRRFGTLPEAVDRRIAQADLATLGAWFDRAVDAPDLEAVFGPPDPGAGAKTSG